MNLIRHYHPFQKRRGVVSDDECPRYRFSFLFSSSFLSHGLPHMLDSHLLTHGCECHWNVMIEHVEKVLYMLFCFLLTRVCFFPVILILSLFFSLSFHDFFSSKIKSPIHTHTLTFVLSLSPTDRLTLSSEHRMCFEVLKILNFRVVLYISTLESK